jgi:hypothetical protein
MTEPPPFTHLDQIHQLAEAGEADPTLAFTTRTLALCSLPRTDPGNRKEYVRRNGPYALVMIAGGLNRLPYGNIPRLLLAWLCTEAVKTQSRELTLGRSLSEFMTKLDLNYDGGGPRGIRTLLRTQMNRLFHTQISLIYEHERGRATISSLIADRTDLWWDPKRPHQTALWDSTIRLGENFFEEIISHPVPINMNILNALKRSSLGLDLYLWLLYRTFALRQPLKLSWRQLYRQFGAEPDQASDKLIVNAFRTDCLRELKKIHLAWPALNYATPRGALEIRPCLEDPTAQPLALFPASPADSE